jgi:predicted DCC family thiol-disulfide oxidoreductase YuxK
MPEVETYFNSRCPVCSTEIGRCRGIAEAAGRAMAWHDINEMPEALARFGVDIDAVRRKLHVMDREGQLRVGVPAFAALWNELPRHRWLARIAMQPFLLPLWTMLYDALAWALYHWNRRRARRLGRVARCAPISISSRRPPMPE